MKIKLLKLLLWWIQINLRHLNCKEIENVFQVRFRPKIYSNKYDCKLNINEVKFSFLPGCRRRVTRARVWLCRCKTRSRLCGGRRYRSRWSSCRSCCGRCCGSCLSRCLCGHRRRLTERRTRTSFSHCDASLGNVILKK
jgi:hypothetical protein